MSELHIEIDGLDRVLTQAEIEERMFYGGVKRIERMMDNAEQKGRAVTNPYAAEILNEYVLPLAAGIKSELNMGRPGIRHAHAVLLGALDADAVAGLAVRHVLNSTLMGQTDMRTISSGIGRQIHSELVLDQIAEKMPDLYHTLVSDFNRRMSKDERHRMTVFKMQAKAQGLVIIEWPVGARDQVGLYLLGMIEALGIVEIEAPYISKGKVASRAVTVHPDIMARINQIKSYLAITMPCYGPCVEAPLDWTTPYDGGFHGVRLRRANPYLVHHRMSRSDYYRNAQMPVVLKAVNTLQRTAWAVNSEVLDIVLEVGKHFSVGDSIMSLKDDPKPQMPDFVKANEGTPTEEWPEWQQIDFKSWKRRMADWHTRRKTSAISFQRFYSATRDAEFFRKYPAIYFVYFADSRGRLYPMTYGMNPQGSDLQKGLLRFSNGLPLTNASSVMWFCVQGANKWGFDKATLEDRQQWVMDREDLILSFASDPISNKGWTEAGDPVQFLAWCLEFSRWRQSPGTFVSHLPISMDGSCNGLQNLSAMLRDEVGGRATNLTDNVVMEDIYRRVAEATAIRLQAARYDDPEKESLRQRWLGHGINRSIVKRSVMTTPYGVTKRAAQDYIVKDYLRTGVATEFDKTEYGKASVLLMEHVWPAIGDVVVKGREAMDWLKACASRILPSLNYDGDLAITWTSPSGFPACQSYFETKIHRVNTKLHGDMKIRVLSETDHPDRNRHLNGMAPNFVHSMDAAHLHLTTAAVGDVIDAVAMIHDDYGTHAANSQFLYETIREQFVRMYEEHDPVAELHALYPDLPAPPSKGGLEIREVLKSRFFFS